VDPLTIKLPTGDLATLDTDCQWTCDVPLHAKLLNDATEILLLGYGPALGDRVGYVFDRILDRFLITEYRFDYDAGTPPDAIY